MPMRSHVPPRRGLLIHVRMSATPAGPLGTLTYLYLGTGKFSEDLAFYRDTLGAPLVWHFNKFGAQVAAFRVAAGPLIILADHRPPGTCMPVFAVDDVDATAAQLKGRGWHPDAGPFEIPDGPCYTFTDRSGNAFALLGKARPGALEASYRPTG
jgi:predicted enzyme related to lactoylglutathione lyase